MIGKVLESEVVICQQVIIISVEEKVVSSYDSCAIVESCLKSRANFPVILSNNSVMKGSKMSLRCDIRVKLRWSQRVVAEIFSESKLRLLN